MYLRLSLGYSVADTRIFLVRRKVATQLPSEGDVQPVVNTNYLVGTSTF